MPLVLGCFWSKMRPHKVDCPQSSPQPSAHHGQECNQADQITKAVFCDFEAVYGHCDLNSPGMTHEAKFETLGREELSLWSFSLETGLLDFALGHFRQEMTVAWKNPSTNGSNWLEIICDSVRNKFLAHS